jgi:acyl CoA:acetate/3-ketoacid CoA transferase beta subunit
VTDPLATADALTWSLARQCRPGDVLVVGVGTPLAIAAGMLARELLVPDLTLIVAGAVQPATHDVAESLLDPTAMARHAQGTFGQAEILDAIARGTVTLQFVSPAQVDAAGRINVTRVRTPDGSMRRLPGPLALPDVSVLVGRLVAYRAEHSPRFLVERVDAVTGAGNDIDRTRCGVGVTRIVTGTAEIELVPGARPRLAALQPGADREAAVAGCGFALDAPDDVPTAPPLPPEARTLLRERIDPHGMRALEVRDGRAGALARLAAIGGEAR